MFRAIQNRRSSDGDQGQVVVGALDAGNCSRSTLLVIYLAHDG